MPHARCLQSGKRQNGHRSLIVSNPGNNTEHFSPAISNTYGTYLPLLVYSYETQCGCSSNTCTIAKEPAQWIYILRHFYLVTHRRTSHRCIHDHNSSRRMALVYTLSLHQTNNLQMCVAPYLIANLTYATESVYTTSPVSFAIAKTPYR